MRNDHQRAPRGTTQGWTDRAVRSNLAFLRSVRLNDLTGMGLAYTLTIRDCPLDSDEWHKLRRQFVERLRRMGMVRLHWVTEWQRRGVPHLHGVVYFHAGIEEYPRLRSAVVDAWVAVAGRYGAAPWAQDCKGIEDALGWLQYLAKHAARGKNHYQRAASSVPTGWLKTGRVWGKSGDWPVDVPLKFEVDREGYWRYRRMVRRWRIADARAAGDRRRIVAARRMLQADTVESSQVRGTSEWIPENVSYSMFAQLVAAGFAVEQVVE